MFSFRRVKSSFFYRFVSLFLICTMLIFSCFNIEKKKVKAIEPITLTYSVYLLIGGLATMCGIKFASMPKEARYDFVSGGFEAIRDIAQWGTDPRGLATKLILNEATIKAFLQYAQSKEGTSLSFEDDFNFVGSSLDMPFVFSQAQGVLLDLCSFTVNKDCSIIPRAYCSGTDSISSLGLVGNPVKFSSGDVVSFKYVWDISTYYFYMVNIYKNGEYQSQAWQGIGERPSKDYLSLDFLLKVDTSLIQDGTFKSFLNKTVLYPKSLTDVRGIEDYNKIYDKTNAGQQSIEVDGSQTGVDIATPIDNANTIANDIVFPSGIEEGVELPAGLKINTGEGSIESSPDLSQDETLEHQGILQNVLDWLGSLVLDLMDFLLGLLDKLIDMLKSLLVSLFVPSLSLEQTKELISSRLSLPIFSAPSSDINKEPFTFTFPIGSFGGVDNSDIVITFDQPWFSVIRELILGYICYLAILFIHKKLSALYGSD